MPEVNNQRDFTASSRRLLAAAFSGSAAFAVACAIALGGASHQSPASPASGGPSGQPQQQSVRIGVYDSRAVAVAYVRSADFAKKMQDLQRQRAEAVKAGDKNRITELDALGESTQVRLNLQGFSIAPVDDVLETVREELAGVAQCNGVIAIARAADYRDASVEAIDITDDLVRLFEPNEPTLKVIGELRKQQPVAIEIAARMPAKQ